MGLPTSYQLSLVLMLMIVGVFHICLGSPIPQSSSDGTESDPNATPPAGDGLNTVDAGALGIVTWHAEPKGRGTIGILVSCSATYIFCIWTSIHPNIMPETSKICRLFYKTVLMFVSIVLPPGIMVCAMGELYDAYRVRKAWNEMRKTWHKEKKITAIDESNELGMYGAFFVVMGGFVVQRMTLEKDAKGKVVEPRPVPSTGRVGSPMSFLSGAGSLPSKAIEIPKSEIQEIAPITSNPLSTSTPSVSRAETGISGRPDTTMEVYWTILTPEGFIEYVKEGRITPASFDKRSMDDKGKANMIAKLFAFLQALWLIVQAFARWGDKRRLPLSLLEVHVIIQVVCTSVIYACWWKKPLDISEPIVIEFVKGVFPYITDQEKLDQALASSKASVQKANEAREAALAEKQKPASESPRYITTKKPTSDFVAVMIKAIFDITKHIYSTKNEWYGIVAVIVEGILVMVVGVLHIIVAVGYDKKSSAQYPTEAEAILWIISCGGMIVLPFLVVFIDLCTRYERDLFRILWEAPYMIEGSTGDRSKSRRSLIPYTFREMHKMCAKRADPDPNKPRSSFSRVLLLVWHYFLLSTCIFFITLTFACSIYFTIDSYIGLRRATDELFETPLWIDFWPHL